MVGTVVTGLIADVDNDAYDLRRSPGGRYRAGQTLPSRVLFEFLEESLVVEDRNLYKCMNRLYMTVCHP